MCLNKIIKQEFREGPDGVLHKNMDVSSGKEEQEKWKAFRQQLEDNYAWPALYIFKFIVPKSKAADVRELFPLHLSTEKESQQGKYTSLTFKMMMPGSDAIIDVYKKVSHIEGIIAL